MLQLGFKAPHSTEDYLYVFQRMEATQTPFKRPWYELPTILVERDGEKSAPSTNRVPWWAFWRRWKRTESPPGPPPIPIRIEIAGGGYYGGINPVYRQFIKIDSKGRLIREVHTAREGLMITKKNISRAELEDFAEWIQEQGYFKLKREYDCDDPECHKRKREKPRPVPLQIVVTVGQDTKVISIPIWGEDNQHIRYIEYPALLDQIVQTVYKMADRIEVKHRK